MYIGHKREQELFKNLLANNRLSHAYILYGVEGIGKRLFAEYIARSVNCERGSFFEECSCKNCTLAKTYSHPDIHIIEKEQIKIEIIRNIISQTESTPFLGRYKVFIIDGADLLSQSKQVAAANALLKTLEEPSGNTLFLLITNNLEIMLPTIKSRSNIIKFSPLTDSEMKIILEYNEDLEIRNDKTHEKRTFSDSLIKFSNGSLKRATLYYDMDIELIDSFLLRRAWKDLAIYIFALKTDKEKLRALLEWLYLKTFHMLKALPAYEATFKKKSYSIFANYIMEIFQKLNYNINVELLECDLISHIITTFDD